MGGDQMMLSNTHRELPSWSVSFCVKQGRNFWFNCDWLPSAQGSWSLSQEILKHQLLIMGRITEVLSYSLEHLRIACSCYLVQKYENPGKREQCYPMEWTGSIEKLKTGLKQERSFHMKSFFFLWLAVCFQSLGLSGFAFHFVSRSTISMCWIF